MSKIYLVTARDKITNILELNSPHEMKGTHNLIKSRLPKLSLGVLGAKDYTTLQRTHRNITRPKLFKDVNKFIEEVAKGCC